MTSLENIKITDNYTLRNLEVYDKGNLCGYVQGMLIDDNNYGYEVLYRIHDTDNGEDYTLISVDYGYRINNDDIIRLVEEKLTEVTKKLNIDFTQLEKAQKEYKEYFDKEYN